MSMFTTMKVAKCTIVTLMVLLSFISPSSSWTPKCDPILLHAGNDPETVVKSTGGMIPGIGLVASAAFASHVAVKKCAYFFGHGGNAKVAGYSYVELAPLIDKYDRVHVFACAQSRDEILADIAKTTLQLAMKAEGLNQLQRAFTVSFDGTTFTAIPPEKGANKDATKQLTEVVKINKAKVAAEDASLRIARKLGFLADKVINLHPCKSSASVCAWLTPTHKQVTDLRIPRQTDQQLITNAPDLGLQLIYRVPDGAKFADWPAILTDLQNQQKEQQRWIDKVFPSDISNKLQPPMVRDVDLDALDATSNFNI